MPWTMCPSCTFMASRKSIVLFVRLWVWTKPGTRERQRGQIHCCRPHPLEPGVELVFNKMKQRLRLQQRRRKHLTSVDATVRALLMAWALPEHTPEGLRPLGSARPTRDDGAAPGAGTRHAAAAGAGPLLGGPSPGMPPPLTPRSLEPSTAPGASGHHPACLAGTTSPR